MDGYKEKLRVFIVDDNRDTADSLAVLVKFWGYHVQSGYNGTALESLLAFQPHVVLLDIGLPKLNGHRITRRLRDLNEYRDALIIAITGFHDDANRLLSQEAGFDHYLIKPVDPSVLEKLLFMKMLSLRQGPC